MVILVGLPGQLRRLLESNFRDRTPLRTVPMKQDGGYRLEPPPDAAVSLLEQFFDEISSADSAHAIIFPYPRIPPQVLSTVDAMAQLGVRVIRPEPNQAGWPSRPRQMDQNFLSALRVAVSAEIERCIPPEVPLDAEEQAIIEEILRGLITHSKMGSNNHSHEDDLWKSRGSTLGPGGKRRILRFMMRDGLIDRKKNASIGGTGWVYWVKDVLLIRARYSQLVPYLS